MKFDDENWSDNPFGKFVDEKVESLNFKNTLVILGRWNAHEENLELFTTIGLTNWYSVIPPDLADLEEHYLGIYCIKINNQEHKELALKKFQDYARAFYARYYEGIKATEAFSKSFQEE